ncbi:MAG: hypothetical protein EON49_17135 [Acidovorax sp.]|nr:MAG: hypothetical protein EON49_17135 [Acidovorax sp.]
MTTKRGACSDVNMCSKMPWMAGTPCTSLNGSLNRAAGAYRRPMCATSAGDSCSKNATTRATASGVAVGAPPVVTGGGGGEKLVVIVP